MTKELCPKASQTEQEIKRRQGLHNDGHPLFLCERVGVELEVLKMSDGMVDQARQNVIYMSRRQLKKHTSTVINFSLNVRFISQQVGGESVL